MNPIQSKKQILRKQMIQRRDALDQRQHQIKSQQACQHVLNHPFFIERPKSRTPLIAMYMPFRSELDITPIMAWCWQHQWKVLVPRVQPETSSFELHYITDRGDLERGTWGIMEPNANLPRWERDVPIDIVFVPGIAFDRKGGRLGSGGGFYDRFFAGYRELALDKPFLLSVAFDLQMVEKLPVEAHDVIVDQVITESGPQIT